MANIFAEAASNPSGIEERLLGPTYPYYKNIKMPSQLGMNETGSIQQMAKNIDGLIGYVELMASGGGSATTTGRPLGNKFFLQTGGKCVDIQTKQDADRYIYINNVPDGDIPFISSGMGVNFKDLKGLIPGVLSDMNVLNPFAILSSFLSGSKPDCQAITMETIDNNNVSSNQTQFVSLADISIINACSFPDGKNPVNGKTCVEAFDNEKLPLDYQTLTLPDDPIVQLYFGCLSVLGIYILYRMIEKKM
uniref:Uncharacterized protein n=1 Tax=viral metagenome TaxID=1070528 RepID=A0A6C0KTS5_9ZZZZ